MSERLSKLRKVVYRGRKVTSYHDIHRGQEVLFKDPELKEFNFGIAVEIGSGSLVVKRLFEESRFGELVTIPYSDHVYSYNHYEQNWCTCGSVYTSNPLHHLFYCHYSKRV
jgi:hypothetical protein